MSYWWRVIAVLWGAFLVTSCADRSATIAVNASTETRDRLGERIFQNECSGQHDCLVHWNEGEAFPSLGIGHFIWYPAGVDEPFVESFPALLAYYQENNVSLPLPFLRPDADAPWPDRQAMMSPDHSGDIKTLRRFLASTKGLQAAFIVQRLEQALGRILQSVPLPQRKLLTLRLRELTRTSHGLYALVDYVNFKGEGLSSSEQYEGVGWGLKQVLLAMDWPGKKSAPSAFSEAAAVVLTRRAETAPRSIEKERWLPGWLNRVKTYRD